MTFHLPLSPHVNRLLAFDRIQIYGTAIAANIATARLHRTSAAGRLRPSTTNIPRHNTPKIRNGVLARYPIPRTAPSATYRDTVARPSAIPNNKPAARYANKLTN